MKRVLIVVMLIVLIWFGYTIVTEGFQYEDFDIDILSYEAIQTKSDTMTKALAAYNKKNDEDYPKTLTSLDSAIKKYQESKEEYEELIEELGTTTEEEDREQEQTIYSSQFAYNIDYLLTTLGMYGNKEGVNVTFDLVKSSTYDANAASLGYTLCNLNFTVSGEYINISHFLYDLEDDDELAFEIRDFAMTSAAATFTVYNLPINNATFIDSLTSSTQNSTSSNQNSASTGTIDNSMVTEEDMIEDDTLTEDEVTSKNSNTSTSGAAVR